MALRLRVPSGCSVFVAVVAAVAVVVELGLAAAVLAVERPGHPVGCVWASLEVARRPPAGGRIRRMLRWKRKPQWQQASPRPRRCSRHSISEMPIFVLPHLSPARGTSPGELSELRVDLYRLGWEPEQRRKKPSFELGHSQEPGMKSPVEGLVGSSRSWDLPVVQLRSPVGQAGLDGLVVLPAYQLGSPSVG